MMYDFFKRVFPGETPKVSGVGKIPMISTTELAENQSVRWIEEPVFLATAIEPATWGRWVANIMPRVRHYLTHGQGRKFLCHANRPWERHTLTTLGVPEDQIIHHEPGCTYLCRDVLHIELEGPVLPISLGERGVLSDFVDKNQVQTSFGEKLFVSRLSASRRLPDYRTLLNEEEAIDFYSQRRFSIIEPELLSLPEQMSAFRSAETIVVVGGSAMFNAAFCVPGTRVVTIESSDSYIQTHMEYLSALDLNYGVIFGQQDPKDSRTLHARWTLDVQKSWDAIEAHWPGIAT
jgi:capsular polysaccharide biosynthesis protein